MSVSMVDISSVTGLIALCLLTANFVLGLMLVTSYKKARYWKMLPPSVRKIRVSVVHNVTAYIALALILVHPVLLLFDASTHFTTSAVLLPMNAPHQPAWVTLGVLALYAILLVIITSQKPIRRALGYRSWKNIHLISFLTVILASLHGIFLDPELKDGAPDYLDGEKLVCEACLAIILITSFLRYRLYRSKMHAKKKTAIRRSRIS